LKRAVDAEAELAAEATDAAPLLPARDSDRTLPASLLAAVRLRRLLLSGLSGCALLRLSAACEAPPRLLRARPEPAAVPAAEPAAELGKL
jgi:hypothetical protein